MRVPIFIKKSKNEHPLLLKLYNNELTNDEKILITEKLGANKFKKLVFKVENLKFKTLKKICPNFLNYYDKLLELQKKKSLKKVHSTFTQQEIIKNINIKKELAHREFHREMNRNYHMNYNRPLEIIEYLKWNKMVHKKGLTKDFIVIGIIIFASILGPNLLLGLLPFELLSALINFECINIQNHNLYRLEAKKEKLKKIQQKNLEIKSEKYSDANELIAKKHLELQDVPSIDDILSSIKTKEQLEQLKGLIEKQIATNNKVIQKGKY